MSIGTRMSRIARGGTISLKDYLDDFVIVQKYVDTMATHAEKLLEEFVTDMVRYLPRLKEIVSIDMADMSDELELIMSVYRGDDITFESMRVRHDPMLDDAEHTVTTHLFSFSFVPIDEHNNTCTDEMLDIDALALVYRDDEFYALRDDLFAEINDILE